MNIFSEIYGAYYRTAARLLRSESVTEKDISKAISEEAFRDSMLFLPKKLIPQRDGSDWGLLRKNADGIFSPVTRHPPVSTLTLLQKSWLLAKLSDPKAGLFMKDSDTERLKSKLLDVKPLYTGKHFRLTDIFSDGDDYTDKSYRNIFRIILRAIKTKAILEVDFLSGHNNRRHHLILPIKLEYSRKNDKFRVYCYVFRKGKPSDSAVVNLGRINRVKYTGEHYSGNISLEKYFAARRSKCPVIVKVTPERNAPERFMTEFASYEKHTEINTETGECTIELWYDKNDETELLIRLLSFGPVIEIISPEHLRRQAAERIARQYELLFGEK